MSDASVEPRMQCHSDKGVQRKSPIAILRAHLEEKHEIDLGSVQRLGKQKCQAQYAQNFWIRWGSSRIRLPTLAQ
jgi:hypothetical protein